MRQALRPGLWEDLEGAGGEGGGRGDWDGEDMSTQGRFISMYDKIHYKFKKIYSYILETVVSGNLCSFLKEVKPLVLYDVEHGIAMEPMKGKWASSRVDLGYTELFCLPEVISVFFSSCDSGLGDSLLFHQAH